MCLTTKLDRATFSPMETSTSFKDWVFRTISVLGLIAILLIGVWGIIQITLAVPGFFAGSDKNTSSDITASTAGSSTTEPEQLTPSLPASITSGQPFTLSWKHQGGSGNYGYLISYSCATGLSIYAPTSSGTSVKVPCNTAFNFTSATETVELTPTMTGAEQVAVTVTVSANKLSDSSTATKGTATATVLPAVKTATPAKTVATKTIETKAATKPATPALYGLPNLVVYINSATLSALGRFTVQFTVVNLGTNVVPRGWMFEATLPLGQTYPYISNPQQTLYPGDKVVYTLGFNVPMQTYTSSYTPYMWQNNCGYTQSYTYNGVYNILNDPIYTCATNSYTIPYYRSQPYKHGTFWIVADPRNFVQETNEVDNAVSTLLN